jgi:hypothetical protein
MYIWDYLFGFLKTLTYSVSYAICAVGKAARAWSRLLTQLLREHFGTPSPFITSCTNWCSVWMCWHVQSVVPTWRRYDLNYIVSHNMAPKFSTAIDSLVTWQEGRSLNFSLQFVCRRVVCRGPSSGCGWRLATNIFVDSWQGVVLRLGGMARANSSSPFETAF